MMLLQPPKSKLPPNTRELREKMETISFRRQYLHGEVGVPAVHSRHLLTSTDIDLTSMIPTLDNTASEIVQYQRDSTVQRKDLAQKTKDFRKLDDATKLVEVKGLLKGK
jgi:hypothetical protein